MIKGRIKFYLLILCILTASLLGGLVSYTNIDSVKTSTELQIENTSQELATATPPSSYDLRDYIDIGVENQNPYGLCYAYASLTSLETYLALTYGEYYDFSELHFALSLYKQAGYYNSTYEALNNGGNFTHFITYTQKEQSLVLEEEMPRSRYQNSSSGRTQMEADYANINNNFYSIVKVDDTVSFPEYVGNKSQYSQSELTSFRNSVKQHIMNYGSLTAGIYTNTSIFTSNTKYYKVTDNSLVSSEQAIINNTNHLVSIVGWDDNYNANGAWSKPGAYLCLNSWGESFGNNGYFYVSYEDYFIERTLQGVVSASPCATDGKISTIENHPQGTFMMTHTFRDANIHFVSFLNTSQYLNQNITTFNYFVKGGSAKFYVKFFDSLSSALNGVNTIGTGNRVWVEKTGEYSLYDQYKLMSPIKVSGNYIALVALIQGADKASSLGGYVTSSKPLNLSPTYYYSLEDGSLELKYFSITPEYKWNPSIAGHTIEATLPLILYTDKYAQLPSFESDTDSFIDSKYLQNNAIFYGKTISLDLSGTGLTLPEASNITVTKPYINSFNNVTSNFNISIGSNIVYITLVQPINSSFGNGNYIIKIPCGDVNIARIITVQDVSGYPIRYHLDGGYAVNTPAYTNKHTSLNLNNPTKAGYTFVGWYTDSNFTQPFDCNNLPYTELDLYAKYDFACPSIISKSNNVSVTYHSDFSRTISVNATHALANQYNSLSYQWYYRQNLTDDFSILTGKTNSSVTVSDVIDSGFYVCEVSIIITDPSLTEQPCKKTLYINENNQISVNIKPYTYDMSQVVWDYIEPFAYDAEPHIVKLVNLPNGVTINYSNNLFEKVGTYTAHAELIYDDMNGNAIANPVDDLVWAIRKANIIITIEDIINTSSVSSGTLQSMYNCTIEHEYLPENVQSKQDIINFLELNYILQDTDNQFIKTITATHKIFSGDEDVYNIQIINGEYRVVIYSLISNDVTSENSKGFAQNCVFEASIASLTESSKALLSSNNLTEIKSYNLSYSYLQENDMVTVSVPLTRQQLLNNLSVYILKDDKLVKVNSKVTSKGISFSTNVADGTYIVVYQQPEHSSNSQMTIYICIIGIYIALCIYAIISAIKHHKEDYYFM